MKEEFENIEEVFKQAFDGYEAPVDSSVWNSVKDVISNNTISNDVSSKVSQSLNSSLTKSFLLKVVAGIVVISSAGVAAFIYTTDEVVEKSITEQVEVVEEQMNNDEISSDWVDKKKISSVKEQILADQKEISVEEGEDKLKEEEGTPVEKEGKLTVSEGEVVTKEEVVLPKDEVKETTIDSPKQDSKTTEEVKTEIKANITASTLSGKAPLEVQFNAEGNGVQYFWEFNDGSTLSNEKSPIHTFSEPGIYKVTLTVLDEYANTKTVVNFVQVEKNVTSVLNEVPNVFSPNGDGSNDQLRITGENIKVFNARVMDASSKVVYEWNNIDEKWDGRDMSGNLLMPGMYYLTVIAIGEDGERHVKKQTIHLYK